MARGKSLANLTIEQLESMLAARRKSQLSELTAKRSALSAELREVEAAIASAGGSASSAAMGKPRRGRPPGSRNKKKAGRPGRPPGSTNKKAGRPGRPAGAGGSMKSAILEELAAAKGADVAVADLIDKLKSRTSSAKPGTIVSLALMALKKSGLVVSAGRGLYKLTPKGMKEA